MNEKTAAKTRSFGKTQIFLLVASFAIGVLVYFQTLLGSLSVGTQTEDSTWLQTMAKNAIFDEVANLGHEQLEEVRALLQHISNNKRDDNDNDDDSDTKKKSKAQSILDKLWIRLIMAIGGIIVFNMFVICVHHVYMLATRNEKSYRTVHHEISPF